MNDVPISSNSNRQDVSPKTENCGCDGPGGINIMAGEGTDLSELIANNTLPDLSLDPDGVFNNTCLSISGTLRIDQDYEIDGGEIIMQPGARIIIETSDELSLTNVDQNRGIHGCDQSWYGILLENSGTLYMENCQVEDAQHAVYVNDFCTVYLKSNDFNRNEVGLYANFEEITQNATFFYDFSNNTFRSEGAPLLPPFDGAYGLIDEPWSFGCTTCPAN